MSPSPDSGPFATSVRRFHPGEFDALERFSRKTPGVHRARLEWQARGRGLCLGAWLGEQPVGHVWLEWVPETDGAAPRPLDCPRLVDLYVVPQLRSRRIGTWLIAAAERAAFERGYACVGLDVGTDNPRAHALYLRRGYVDAGLGQYRISWPSVDAEGRPVIDGEECVYLVRRLCGPDA